MCALKLIHVHVHVWQCGCNFIFKSTLFVLFFFDSVSKSAFVGLTDQNTLSVPLTLVLSLSRDIPVCASIMLKLQQTVYGTGKG